MKRTIFNIVIMAGLALCLVSFSRAQGSGLYRASIPFDFSVGTKHFTAGVYLIEVRGVEQRYFVLRDLNGRNAYAINTVSVDSKDGHVAALDFRRLGENYALAEIRASSLISTLPKPRIEDMLARGKTKDATVRIPLSKGR